MIYKARELQEDKTWNKIRQAQFDLKNAVENVCKNLDDVLLGIKKVDDEIK